MHIPGPQLSGSCDTRGCFQIVSSCSRRLNLSSGHMDLFGEHYWELCSPYREGRPPLNTGSAPRVPIRATLSEILEPVPERKYYLSKTACLGILRRAEERGKELPPQLQSALMAQTGLDRVPGALLATTNMQMRTFIAAGFSAGAGASAGSVAYSERVAPTLKGTAGGNCMPSVLCLNDQGGSVMECSENVTGTLRAQEHGHQPIVYENHGIDARYTGPYPVSPTLSARGGTGGNNLPLVEQDGTVFSRQRVDGFKEDRVVSTESARQHKDATDLACQEAAAGPPLLIRRLTPLECERLQGFPDGWTDLPGASDSARYRALGNSVAIPCVEYVLRGIVMAAGHCDDDR